MNSNRSLIRKSSWRSRIIRESRTETSLLRIAYCRLWVDNPWYTTSALNPIKTLVQCDSSDCCGAWWWGQFFFKKCLNKYHNSLRCSEPHKPEKWSDVSQFACIPLLFHLFRDLVISELKLLFEWLSFSWDWCVVQAEEWSWVYSLGLPPKIPESLWDLRSKGRGANQCRDGPWWCLQDKPTEGSDFVCKSSQSTDRTCKDMHRHF